MPQFDFATFPGQIFWLIITFAVQYLVMTKLVVPNLKSIFSKRCNYVEEQIGLAEKYAEQAEKIHLEYEKKIADAKQVSLNAISEASAQTHKEVELALMKLQNKLLEDMHKRELRSKRSNKASTKTMNDMVLSLAAELITKTANVKVNKKDLSKYI